MTRPKIVRCEHCGTDVSVKPTGRVPRMCPECRRNRSRTRRDPVRPWDWKSARTGRGAAAPAEAEPLNLEPQRSVALTPLLSRNDRSPHFHHQLEKWKRIASVLAFVLAVLAGLAIPFILLG